MWEYMKLHEEFIKSAIHETSDKERLSELKEFHIRQLSFMQHERLVHLIVTLFVSLFTILSFGLCCIVPSALTVILSVLFLILTSAYIVHYFRLENGVQRWYHITNLINKQLGKPGACYDSHKIVKNN